MRGELEKNNAPKWIWNLYEAAWEDFKKNKWSYDGSTFGPERKKCTQFEVASFDSRLVERFWLCRVSCGRPDD